MKLGAERNKLILLVVLVVIAIGGLYLNSTDDAPKTTTARVVSTAQTTATTATTRTPRTKGRPANSEFRPKVGGGKPDDHLDPGSIDPELRLDLLAKVQAVPPIEAGRNLFQFGAAPAPDKPLAPIPPTPKIQINQPPPQPPPTIAATTPQPPPVQPINLKYYGYVISKVDGQKKAALLDGDDILVVTENQTVKQRYRIVKIALGSIDIEDIQGKNTQTLKLQDIPG